MTKSEIVYFLGIPIMTLIAFRPLVRWLAASDRRPANEPSPLHLLVGACLALLASLVWPVVLVFKVLFVACDALAALVYSDWANKPNDFSRAVARRLKL